MTGSVNYPDILGAITKGVRANAGAVQVALAARPAVPRAGRPFEVILLVQNATDADLEVAAAITLPDMDARKQKARFAVKAGRVTVGVKAAEMGYLVLPVFVAPDAAPAPNYKLSVEVDAKPLTKATRLRAEAGGGAVEVQFVSAALKDKIVGLRALAYSVAKRQGRNAVDLTFDLAPANPGDAPSGEPAAGWVSVCKVSDYKDDRYLLHRYGNILQIKTLPQLKRAAIYEPLVQTTSTRFEAAGYPLKHAEAGLIAKLLTLILEYASPRHTGHGHIAAGIYNADSLISLDPFTLENKPYIPHWMRAYVSAIERDARSADHALPVLTRYIYEDVLRDGVDYAFELIETDSGEDVGSAEERENYREKLIAKLKAKAGLDFSTVYLPLVMGGMIVSDRVMLPKESPSDLLKEVSHALESRIHECEPDDPIFSLSQDILWRTGQKYGIKLS